MQQFFKWLPSLDYRVWLLMGGRSLSQLGTGFTLFYAPIFFVNQIGLSAAAVGLGLGSQSISGILGRIAGGSLADSPRWGRRKTLLVSAAVSALADGIFTVADNFPTFLLGNLLMGLGIGLYWPATEAVVADITTPDQRNEAYALTRLGDNIGLGLGVVLGGVLVATTEAFRALFMIDGLSFVVFFGIIYWAIAETLTIREHPPLLNGWKVALSDRILLIYALVNSCFTTYLSLINSALPLYFSSFIPGQGVAHGFSASTLSGLFSWHVILTIVAQLPIVRLLNRFSRISILMTSALFWSLGFFLVWVTGIVSELNLGWAILALGMLAIATVTYTPAASSLVVALSPDDLRGVYLSVNSLCWAVGYFIGPILGGWAMGHSRWIADGFWLGVTLSVAIAVMILKYLRHIFRTH